MYRDGISGLIVTIAVSNQNLLHSSRVYNETCEVVRQNIRQPKENLFAARSLRSKIEDLEVRSDSCADVVVVLWV